MENNKNHLQIFLAWLTGLSVLALLTSASAAAVTMPLDVIKSGTTRAMEILKSAKVDKGLPLEQRKTEILTIVDDYFNFEEMAKRAVGPAWKSQSPEDQTEFVRLFKDLLFDTYIDRVNTYTDIEGTVEFTGQEIQGEFALVKTMVVGHNKKNVAVDYRLRLQDQRWKVYDVIIVGVSLVSNYRSQFSAILVNNSFSTVVEKLREKAPNP